MLHEVSVPGAGTCAEVQREGGMEGWGLMEGWRDGGNPSDGGRLLSGEEGGLGREKRGRKREREEENGPRLANRNRPIFFFISIII